MKKNNSTIWLVLILLIGLSLILYPSVSDYWNSFHQTRAIVHYAEAVAGIGGESYRAMWRSAADYNARVAQRGIVWELTDEQRAAYEAELDVTGTGIMGYIEIPKISCSLPIYHSTAESVLQVAVGHLEGSSLPVGGESTHCLLSGHRGLPSARLFTDIDQLAEGDSFLLRTLDETLSYQVDQICIVLPYELDELRIEPGEDLCTLITCTPYGINSHRLLVRGHRIDNPMGDAKVVADAMQIDKIYVVPFVGVPILLILLILLLFSTGKHARRRDSYSEVRAWEEELKRTAEEENPVNSAEP